jgi:hypothetical protein
MEVWGRPLYLYLLSSCFSRLCAVCKFRRSRNIPNLQTKHAIFHCSQAICHCSQQAALELQHKIASKSFSWQWFFLLVYLNTLSKVLDHTKSNSERLVNNELKIIWERDIGFSQLICLLVYDAGRRNSSLPFLQGHKVQDPEYGGS